MRSWVHRRTGSSIHAPVSRSFVAPQALAAGLVLARLSRGARRRAPLHGGVPAPEEAVSVVVPARDEEARLGPCLDALRADPDAGEVLVVDDGSRDATAALARSRGARVLPGAPPPPGWAGKAWALQQGLEAAEGEWVVFLDADTRPRPGLLRALVHAGAGRTLVSAGPRFACPGGAERALHASMLATIAFRVGPTDVEGWQPRPERAIANGQCLAARRADLLAAGGWERVRGALVEDVALARALRAEGWAVVFADAADLLEVMGYGGLRATWSGWGRSLLAEDVEPPARVAEHLLVLWLAMALPLPRLLTGRGGPLDALLALVRLALLAALRRSYEPRGVAFWLSPLLDVPTLVRLTWSALRPSRAWRGRVYAPRRARRSAP
jgi:dolichol-phosphate mannosyltransferase